MADSWQSMKKQQSFIYPPLYGTVECKWYLRKIVKEICLRLAAGFPIKIDCDDHTEALDGDRPLCTLLGQNEQPLSDPATPHQWQGELFPGPLYFHALATNTEERFDPNITGYEQREDAETIRLQRGLRKSEHKLRRERRRRIEASKPATSLRESSKPTTGLRKASQEKLCPICFEVVCNWSLLCGHFFCIAGLRP
ncbi:MAG: hypothetical protein LQ350_008476 [Teloschistes chrysophthalmus]|nr:MAG: hypothetical protein LQ350_008476 [Niorma chrysophthalma]